MSRIFSIIRKISGHLMPQARLVPVSCDDARRRAAIRGVRI